MRPQDGPSEEDFPSENAALLDRPEAACLDAFAPGLVNDLQNPGAGIFATLQYCAFKYVPTGRGQCPASLRKLDAAAKTRPALANALRAAHIYGHCRS